MPNIYNKFPARERIRKIKKRNDRIFRIRLSAVALSAIMSISPALTYVTYAEGSWYDNADTSTIIETVSDTESDDTELNTETTFLFINLRTTGGKVIIDEDTENEQSVRLMTRTVSDDDWEYADENGDVEYIELYDKDDVLISSEPAENNGYTYVYETVSDSVITVKAEADEGYELLRYEITSDEIAEETDFSEPGMSFTHPVFMDDDKTAYVEFSKTIESIVGDENEEDFEITGSDDVIGGIGDNIDEIVSESDASSEYENEVTDDITVGETDSADRTESDESSPDADIDESDDETGDKPYDESYDDKTQDKLSDITVRTEDSDDSSKDIQETQDELPDVTIETGNTDEEDDLKDIDMSEPDISMPGPDDYTADMTTADIAQVDDYDISITDEDDIDTNIPDVNVNASENYTDDDASIDTDIDVNSNIDSDSDILENIYDTDVDSMNSYDTNTISVDTDDYNTVEAIDSDANIDISSLNADDFASMRLILITDSESDIIDDEYLIGSFGNLFLLQYETVEQAMKAYMYYLSCSCTVEPDKLIQSAEEEFFDGDDIDITDVMTEDDNPITTLFESESIDIDEATQNERIIALIDTGISNGVNIIDRISMLGDDVESTSTHGNDMVAAITSQNPDAKILSIKALDDNGNGTVSSVVAAMEYAINNGAYIINLSMYAKLDSMNSVIAYEIQKADSQAIQVVGAAGNDGADVSGYTPGSVQEAIVVGACNETGQRRVLSNYGRNVSYYVNAESTSEAAAKMSGYLSKANYDDIDTTDGVFFDTKETEKLQVDTDFGEQVFEGSDGQLKLYVMLHDGTVENENTMGVFNTMTIHMPYTIEDGKIHCQINPKPDYFDYVEEEYGEQCGLDVDINRGGHGTGENQQVPITDECIYDETTGYIDIPAEYADEDLTVTIWQSKNSVFYKTSVPDEVKPKEDRTGIITAASFASDFPHGVNPIFNAVGCNVIEIKSLDNVKQGDVYSASVSANGTWYVGYGVDEDQKDWSFVPGTNQYAANHGYGQIVNIESCSNANFVNAGTEDIDGEKNWLFVACISNVSNQFAGTPHSYGNSYIECLSINDDKTEGEFYLHLQFQGPYGQTAQTMCCLFKAEVEDSYVVFNKTLGLSKTFSTELEKIQLRTTFTIYSDFACTKKVTTIKVQAADYKKDVSTKVMAKLDPGTYYMKETGRCPGTVHNLNKYKFTITRGKNTNRLSILDGDTTTVLSTTGTIRNDPFYFKGTLLTKYATGTTTPVSGAVFKVEYSAVNDDSSTAKDEFTSNADYRVWYMKTDSDGNIVYDAKHRYGTFTHPDTGTKYKSGRYFYYTSSTGEKVAILPSGYLRFTEIYVPDGYILDDTVYTAKLVAAPKNDDGYYVERKLVLKHTGGTSDWKNKGIVYNDITNTSEYWRLRMQAIKVDSNGNGLEGAVFGVYTDKACTKKLLNGNEQVALTSESDGKTNIVTIKGISSSKTSITYYLKEIQAPDGYAPSNTVYSQTWNKSDYDVLYIKDKNTTGEEKTFGPSDGIVNEKGWTVRVKTKKINAYLQPLEGAVFGVYTDSACTKQIGEDLVSGEDGNTNILHIGVASTKSSITLYCKEKSAPDGYIMSDDVYSLTFKKSNYSSDEPAGQLKSFGPTIGIQNSKTKVTPTPTPEPSSAGLSVKKVSSANDEILALSGYSLEGAEFSITASGYSETLKTGSDGISNSVALPDNHIETWIPEEYDGEDNLISEGYMKIDPVTTTYTITETKAPKGHKLNSASKTLTVKMPRDADETFTVEFNDDPIFCSSAFDIEKLGEKGEIVQGAVFKVEFFDADSATGDAIKTWYLKSDSTGHVKMDSSHLDSSNTSDSFFTYNSKVVIPIGGYLQITEISAPAEYDVTETPVGTKTSQDADLSFTYSNGKAWYNDYQKCQINIKKYDSDGKTPLSGVSYELKFVSAAINATSKKHPDFKRLLDVGGTITRTTDSNGEICFDNLDQGTYQLTETETVKGHVLLTDVITVVLPMTMTKTEADSYGNVNFDTAVEDKGYTNKWFFYECTYAVTNNYAFKMPMTGSSGILKFGLLGFGTLAVLGTGLIVYESMDRKQKRRRKRRK